MGNLLRVLNADCSKESIEGNYILVIDLFT